MGGVGILPAGGLTPESPPQLKASLESETMHRCNYCGLQGGLVIPVRRAELFAQFRLPSQYFFNMQPDECVCVFSAAV
jgi:hypothetical protein